MTVQYGSDTAVSLNADGLAAAAARQGAAVDNTVDLAVDVLVTGKVATAAGTPAANASVDVYAYSWSQAGSYSAGATGAEGAYTLPANTTNLRLLHRIPINAAGTTELMPEVSLAAAFGGVVPKRWGLVVANSTGLALAGTAGQAAQNAFSYLTVKVD